MATFYSSLKFTRFQKHLEALKNQTVEAPVHVRIKPTNQCNHDCWYCAYKVSNLRLGEEMVETDHIPPAKMDEVIIDLIDMGVKAVTFSGGGEPLLYKPLPNIVERLVKGGVRVATLSNGTNLKGRMARAFAEYGTWVRISIDAWDDRSYQKARGLKDDAFSQVVQNMRDFTAQNSRCVLGVSFVVTPDNYLHIPEVCALFKDAGVDHVKLSGVVVANDGGDNNEYHQDIHLGVVEKVAEAQSLVDDCFSIINHYHELEERFDKDYDTCNFLQFLTVIGADCRVYSCQDKAYTQGGLLGDIRDQSFKTFWFSEENRRRLFSLNPARECCHHCVSHSKNLAIQSHLDLDPDHAMFV